MHPEYYADLNRRYQTFLRNYVGNRIYKIASGATDLDFNWTKVVMKNALMSMDGLSHHYYTIPGAFVKERAPLLIFQKLNGMSL